MEMVQRRAAHFVCKDYRRENGIVTGLLSKLEWPTLQERRAQSRLTLMYKTVRKLSALDIHDGFFYPKHSQINKVLSHTQTLLPRETATNTRLLHAPSQSGITSLPTSEKQHPLTHSILNSPSWKSLTSFSSHIMSSWSSSTFAPYPPEEFATNSAETETIQMLEDI